MCIIHYVLFCSLNFVLWNSGLLGAVIWGFIVDLSNSGVCSCYSSHSKLSCAVIGQSGLHAAPQLSLAVTLSSLLANSKPVGEVLPESWCGQIAPVFPSSGHSTLVFTLYFRLLSQCLKRIRSISVYLSLDQSWQQGSQSTVMLTTLLLFYDSFLKTIKIKDQLKHILQLNCNKSTKFFLRNLYSFISEFG